MKVLNIDDQNISDEQMRSISAKTMVIVGDADGVKLDHALAMFKLRGGGDEEAAASGVLQKVPAARLVVLPATSHIGISGAPRCPASVTSRCTTIPHWSPARYSSSSAPSDLPGEGRSLR
jgi:hypothetical protein